MLDLTIVFIQGLFGIKCIAILVVISWVFFPKNNDLEPKVVYIMNLLIILDSIFHFISERWIHTFTLSRCLKIRRLKEHMTFLILKLRLQFFLSLTCKLMLYILVSLNFQYLHLVFKEGHYSTLGRSPP